MSDDENQNAPVGSNTQKGTSLGDNTQVTEDSDESYTPPRRSRNLPSVCEIAPSEKRLRFDLYQTVTKLCSCINAQESVSKHLVTASTTLSQTVRDLTTLFKNTRSEIQNINNPSLFHSTVRDNDIENVQVGNETEPLQIQTTFLNEMSQTFKEIRKSFDSNQVISKSTLKRDYKLTRKMSLNIWKDHLNSELEANNLLSAVHPNTALNNYTPDELNRLKKAARDIIISHIDEYYHNKVVGIQDPGEILQRIREARQAETNVTSTSIRAQLYNLKMSNKEKVNDFIDRFDKLVKEYESFDKIVPLSEEEKRSAFYQAVSEVHKDLSTINYAKRQSNNSDMTLNEIKMFMLQQEAEKRTMSEVRRSESRANIAMTDEGAARSKCYRCNKFGHLARNCPLAQYHAWYCFYCQTVTNHKGDECPNRDNPKDGYVKKHPFKTKTSTNNIRENKRDFRGKGKGIYRGKGGRVTKQFGKGQNLGRGPRNNNPKVFYSDTYNRHLDRNENNSDDEMNMKSEENSEAQ